MTRSYQAEAIYVDEKEVARIRNCGLSTLRNERSLGRGIPYVRDGRRVKYFLPTVYEFLSRQEITPRNNQE